jgi:hypothetical protein
MVSRLTWLLYSRICYVDVRCVDVTLALMLRYVCVMLWVVRVSQMDLLSDCTT